MINYNNKTFKAISNSESGEVDENTTFHYYQKDNIVWGTYNGSNIKFGTLTGIVHDKNDSLHFAYQHVNNNNELMTGKCTSSPEVMPNGKLRLHEKWQWTCKDHSTGESIIEEI